MLIKQYIHVSVNILMVIITFLLMNSCSKKTTNPNFDQVFNPDFSPISGIYGIGQEIKITCKTNESEIRYTLNGSDPNSESELYVTPLYIPNVFINGSNYVEIKARAYKDGLTPSHISSAQYAINYINTVQIPMISPDGGVFSHPYSVTITCDTEGAQIRFTTDGSEPNYLSQLYTSSLSMNYPTTVKAIAYKATWNPSMIASVDFAMKVSDPEFSILGGTYNNNGPCYLSCATDEAIVYHTFNGEEPTIESGEWDSYVNLITGTLKAKAFKTGWIPSNTVSQVYNILINQIGSCLTIGEAKALSIDGNYAYMANSLSGLKIIDISNPYLPIEVGCFDTPGQAVQVKIRENFAYVADGLSGLRIIDISNKSNPIEVGYDTSGGALGVFISGEYAYVADYQAGMRIVDISSPSNPINVGSTNVPDNARDVYVVGNYAYVANWSSGLKIFDVSNPINPTLVGSVNTPGACNKVFVHGNYAYVADTFSGFRIINISNSSYPYEVGHFEYPYGQAYSVFADDSYAYLAYGFGLIIVNISNVQQPFEMGFFLTFNTVDLAINGNYAYITDGNFSNTHLRIIDFGSIINKNYNNKYKSFVAP